MDWIHDAWLITGITLVLFLLLEGSLSLAFFIRDRLHPSSEEVPDRRVEADVYDHEPWAFKYYKEFRKSFEVRWRPYVYWRRPPFHGSYIGVDDRGFRRTAGVDSRSKEGGTPVRIVMLGGSTLWGTGARDEFTIPSLLTRELEKHGYIAEILNCGESGYVSTQEVIMLMMLLQNGERPGLVISYDGVNDTFSAYQERAAGLPQNESHREAEFNLSKSTELKRRLAMDVRDIAESLSTARFVNGLLSRVGITRNRQEAVNPVIFGVAPVEGDALSKGVIDVYRANMELVMAFGSHFHFDHLFYWQPTIFQKTQLTPYEETKKKEMTSVQEHFLKTYEALRQSQISEQDEFHFTDLSLVFSDVPEPVFVDWCHIGEAGNEMIAKRIAGDVLRLQRPH